MLILTYFLAILIGLSLGLIGGGGSILSVPILVYITGIDPVLATSYSLLIVGASSSVAAYQKSRLNLIDYKKGLLFGIPSIISVYLTRAYILPNLPEILFDFKGIEISKNLFIMVFFSIIMLMASYSMIKGRKDEGELVKDINYFNIMSLGLIVGMIVSFVGAGGGFLIVPTLVYFTGLDIKKAIGTSLFIMVINSAFGSIGDFIAGVRLDYIFVFIFVVISIIGIILGNRINKSITGSKLRRGFGIFILIMAILILIKETVINYN